MFLLVNIRVIRGKTTRRLPRTSGSLSGVPETFPELRGSRRVFPKACHDFGEAVG
jgi:hypothetical protein